MNSILLLITTLFSGLMAGLFYAWSISVTPGLAKIDNSSYLKAFQSMNRAILNPAILHRVLRRFGAAYISFIRILYFTGSGTLMVNNISNNTLYTGNNGSYNCREYSIK